MYSHTDGFFKLKKERGKKGSHACLTSSVYKRFIGKLISMSSKVGVCNPTIWGLRAGGTLYLFALQLDALPRDGRKQQNRSRAGVSFLGQIISGFPLLFLLESSPTCTTSAAFQKQSARRKYALDVKQTLQYPLICQIISVNINNILQNTACF